MAKQPWVTTSDDILLWNGDVFGGIAVPEGVSDTQVISNTLEAVDNDDDIPVILSKVQGPFAFVYFRKKSSSIFFGRDFFGRHCLLISKIKNRILLASVSNSQVPCQELPAMGLYKIDLNQKEPKLTLFPWATSNLDDFRVNFDDIVVSENIVLTNNLILPNIESSILSPVCKELKSSEDGVDILQEFLRHESQNVSDLYSVLKLAVKTRVECQPNFCKNCIVNNDYAICDHAKIGVLFSGGLDSVILTRLADEIIPENEEIDLLNVAFQQQNGSFQVPDRITAIQALDELRQINPQRKFNFIEINVTKSELIAGDSLEHSKTL